MKSKHRHELKTNELAEWLVNLPQWIKENQKTIIGIVVLIVVIIGFFSWRSFKGAVQEQERLEFTGLLSSVTEAEMQTVNAQMQGNDISYILLQRAGDLKKFSETTGNNNIAAISLIKQADAIRAELHYRMEDISKQVLTDQINQAKTSYTKAIELSSSNNSLRAIATFGLGLCAEELGNFNEARQIYQDVADNPDFEGTATAVQAGLRLKTMSDYEKDIVFLPNPTPEPDIASTPQVQVVPVDPNMPFDMNSIGANLPFDINMINIQTDSNLPKGENLPAEVNVPLEVNFPTDANSESLTTENNSIEILPVSNPDTLSLSTYDVRQVMEKAGFSSEQISQYETEVRNALGQTGAVQIKKKDTTEALLAVRDNEVYISTRQRGYFVYNVNEGSFIGASADTSNLDIMTSDIPKDSDVNVPVE